MKRVLLIFALVVAAGAVLAQSPQTTDTEEFSEEALNQVLRQVRSGLEGHNARRVLAAFDAEHVNGYLELEDQIQQLLKRYESLRMRYRIVQSSTEETKGIALVEMQMEASPRDSSSMSLRREQQIRFEFGRGKEGWKIVDFKPREFFAP